MGLLDTFCCNTTLYVNRKSLDLTPLSSRAAILDMQPFSCPVLRKKGDGGFLFRAEMASFLSWKILSEYF
jgi:hypothetical protein